MRSEYIRSTHPVGPPVPKLRLLGTSWYRRGPGYWVRRVWLTFVYLVALGCVALFVGALVAAVVTGMTGVGRVVVLVLVVGVVVASYVQAIRTRRRRASTTTPTPEQRRVQARRRRASGGAGLGTGLATSGGSVVGGAFLFVGSLAVIGTITLIVVDSLGRYLNNDEYVAAQKVEAWRAEHPDWQP